MKQSTKIFEGKFIRKRNAIERKCISMIKRALSIQYKSFLDKVKHTDKSQWYQLAESLQEEPIKDFFKKFYPLSAPLAVMSRKNLLGEKAEDEIYESIFSAKLAALIEESGTKITSITNTSRDEILKIIQNVLAEGEAAGLGIPEITSNLYKAVGRNLRGNGYARARAIAQTEMISASNQASTFAVESTEMSYRKFWSTSGLQGIRDSHLRAEQFSAENNGIAPDARFPNGLLYPGDPAGPPGEIINCRCTILHELI